MKFRSFLFLTIFSFLMLLPVASPSQIFFNDEEEITMDYSKSDNFFGTSQGRAIDWNQSDFGNQAFGEQPSPAPLGSGLAVLLGAGFGYGLLKNRKKNKRKCAKICTLLIACLLAFTQCTKTPMPEDGSKIHFMLTTEVSGSRHEVLPNEDGYVPVRYEIGDIIYVGDGTQYTGSLTCTQAADENGNHALFEGDILTPANGDYMYFYFVSNLIPENFESNSSTLETGETAFTVDIADQHNKLAVLSVGRTLYDGANTGSCTLLNQCALVEFKFAEGTNRVTKISNMFSEARIDFSNINHPFAPSGTLDAISLYSTSNTNKWAILMLANERKSMGMVYVETLDYNGDIDIYDYYANVTVPALTACDYLYGDNAITVNNTVANKDNKVFVVSANGNAVHFTTSNLICRKNGTDWTNYTWDFAEHPYDVFESNNFVVGTDHANIDVVTHFGWGCTGIPDKVYNSTQTYYMPYNTVSDAAAYGPTGMHSVYPEHNSDWGAVAPNSEGYNLRILTSKEFTYLLTHRYNATGRCGNIRVTSASFPGTTLSALNGFVIFPEDWVNNIGWHEGVPAAWSTNTVASLDELTALLDANDAIFFPADGYRAGTVSAGMTKIRSINSEGDYWLSDPYDDNMAYSIHLGGSASTHAKMQNRATGMNVRLVY